MPTSQGAPMDRRTFLKAGVGIGASGIWLREHTQIIPAGFNSSLFSGYRTAATPTVFPQSVGSGDSQPNGIVLWTRLAPEAIPGGGSTAVVSWQISSTPNFESNDIVLQGVQSVSSAGDFTAKVIASTPALQPWTLYYYRFGFEGVLSNTGRFKTLPSPGMNLASLRLGYISCQDYSNGYYTALAALAEEQVDYVVHLGDYIYETSGPGAVRVVPPLPSGNPFATTLDDYRHLYRTYRSDGPLQRVHENFAFIQIWDDHEFANDSYQDFHPDNHSNPSVPTPQLRQAANQAWSEYSAANTPFDPRQEPLHSIQIYRSFKFGTLADLVMTDERLYRDSPPCGLGILQRYFTPGCPNMNNPARSMLGSTQRAWFLERMQSSSAKWKIWGNEVMNMPLRVINGTNDIYMGLDSWDGYPAERASILLSLANVDNLVAITGDIHSYVAGYLKAAFDSLTEPRLGVEFVTGSVTSANLLEIISGSATPPTNAPVPPQLLKEAFPGGLLSAIVRFMNPEMVFFNSETHGYAVLDITPERLRCTMRNVSTVTTPQAGVSTLASFIVPTGQHQIIRI
jgi:alkaline phosphatase D